MLMLNTKMMLMFKSSSNCTTFATKPLLLQARFTLSSGAYEGSFKDRAAGKAQLKEFYKFTHPDFFSKAPKNIKETNETSMQTLNAYLQSTQTLNQAVHSADLTFFVSKAKLLQSDSDDKKKKSQTTKDSNEDTTESGYLELNVKLDGLKHDISYQLRQKNYTDAVRTLINALDEASIDMENRDGASVADKLGLGDFRNQFHQSNLHAEDMQKSPERMEKVFRRMTEQRYHE